MYGYLCALFGRKTLQKLVLALLRYSIYIIQRKCMLMMMRHTLARREMSSRLPYSICVHTHVSLFFHSIQEFMIIITCPDAFSGIINRNGLFKRLSHLNTVQYFLIIFEEYYLIELNSSQGRIEIYSKCSKL